VGFDVQLSLAKCTSTNSQIRQPNLRIPISYNMIDQWPMAIDLSFVKRLTAASEGCPKATRSCSPMQ
jgi:hypothetical protein